MLLRSLSTPVLGSLLPSKEIEPEAKYDRSSFCCLSYFSASHFSVNCNFPHESLKRDVVREIARFPRVRRAKSENDLHILDKICMPPAKVAADGFCSSDGNGAHERSGIGEIGRHPSRLTSLRKHSLVSTISGQFGSGFEMKKPLQSDFVTQLADTNHTAEHLEAEATLMTDFSGTKHNRGLAVLENADAKSNQISMGNSSGSQAKFASEETDLDSWSHPHLEAASFSRRKYQDCNMRSNNRCTSTGEAAKINFNVLAEESKKLGLGLCLAGDGGYGDYNGRRFVKDSGDNPEERYPKMLKANANHPLLLRNYACFLFEVRKDYKRAEEYFERAILAMPGDGEVLTQYANLIWQHYGDEGRAAIYYEQAVQAAPCDPYVLAANASFVWASENDEEEADKPSVSILPIVRHAAAASA